MIAFKGIAFAVLGQLLSIVTAEGLTVANDDQNMSGLTVNAIPYSTRVKYMRLVLPPYFDLIISLCLIRAKKRN